MAERISGLSAVSKKIRTLMWSALQSTLLFQTNPELAAGGLKALNDEAVIAARDRPKEGSASTSSTHGESNERLASASPSLEQKAEEVVGLE